MILAGGVHVYRSPRGKVTSYYVVGVRTAGLERVNNGASRGQEPSININTVLGCR